MKHTELLTQIQTRLDQLNTRERKLVTWGGTVALALIGWFVLLEPAIVTIQQAPANQAALVDKAGQVMRAAQDLEALRGARSRVVVPESDLQVRLQQLLEEQGEQAPQDIGRQAVQDAAGHGCGRVTETRGGGRAGARRSHAVAGCSCLPADD